MSSAITPPYVPILDLTGLGLSGGKAYIGEPTEDPETNPQAVYWDAQGTIPASQPLAVVGGYIMRSGTPAVAYTGVPYSMRVRTPADVQVFYEPVVYPTGGDIPDPLFIYPDYQAAEDALPILLEGAFVEVEIDETHNLDRTRYEVVSGDLSLVTTLPAALDGRPIYYDEYGTRFTWSFDPESGAPVSMILPHIYIDPWNGNDANDGLTSATAVRTLAGLITLPLMGPDGTEMNPTIVRNLTICIIGNEDGEYMRQGFDFFNQSILNGYRQMQACTWVRADGRPVKGNCCDIALNASFSAYGPVANSYQISWTPDMTGGSVSRFTVFSDGKPLKRVSSTGGIIAGTYYYAGVPTYGVPTTIIIKDYDSSNVISNGKQYEITKRDSVITMRGGRVQGIWGYMNGHNSGSFTVARDVGQVGDPSQLRGVLAYHGPDHNAVFGYGHHIDVIGLNTRDGDYDPGGQVPVILTGAQADYTGTSTYMTRCWSLVDTSLFPGIDVGQLSASAFLIHDGLGFGGDLISLTDCGSVGVADGWNTNLATRQVYTGHYVPAVTAPASLVNMITSGANPVQVNRSFLGGAAFSYRWINGTDIELNSNLFISDVTFSGGGFTTLSTVGSMSGTNNLIIAIGQAAPIFDLTASGTLVNSRNLIIQPSLAFGVSTYNPTPVVPPDITSDYNLFQGAGGLDYAQVENVAYILADWVTFSGQDTNTVAVTSATDAGFTSGAYPSLPVPDIRYLSASKIDTKMTDTLSQAEVDAMLARPTTLAEAEAYLLTAPSLLPVYVA